MLVGAAADQPRRRGAGLDGASLRATDTGELAPVPGQHTDSEEHLDPEELRYAPRAPRRFLWLRRVVVLGVVVGLVAVILVAGYRWSQGQYYVAADGEQVVIYRGVEADLPGVSLHSVEETSTLTLTDLPDYNARQVRDGISASSLDDARGVVSRLERLVDCPEPAATSTPSPTASSGAKPGATASAKPSAKPSDQPSAQPSPKPGASPSATPTTTPPGCEPTS